MRISLVAALAFLTAWSGSPAGAAEITLIAPGGIRAVIEQLIPDFEAKTGHTVKATFGSGKGTHAQVARGDAFDVPVVQPPYDDVIASGHVVTSSATPLATVSVGIAVRAGAPKPDISSDDAVRRVLLAANSLAYPNPALGAAAGVSFEATLQKLGIAEAMKPKLRLAARGAGAMAMLAKGETELGVTFVSEIVTEPGVEAVGPLPRDVSPPTGLVAFVSAQAKDPDAAKALVSFLSSPEAAPVYRTHGMEPGGP
ncbi:MAG TPA: molybdate ABC transporter substrate-binding protein [Stellaceae bacterium]|nr:molybdate ABC transporter substrate-binding protein [Stellaceae bacterium]